MSDKEKFDLELTPGAVKPAMKEHGAPSMDLWMVPVAALRVMDGFNVRTQGPSYDLRVAELGASILENGFNRGKPLEVFIAREEEGNAIYVVDGHTRLRAVAWANERGKGIESLPCVQKPNGTSMEDLVAGLVTSNNGANLSPLEKAEVCKRLIGRNLTEAQIALKLGFTAGYVGDLLLLIGSNKRIRTMVADNQVSAALAVDAIRKKGAKAADFLAEKYEGARAAGKKKLTKAQIEPKAPKRDILAIGIAWIQEHAGGAREVEFLAHLAGVPVEDVQARMKPMAEPEQVGERVAEMA